MTNFFQTLSDLLAKFCRMIFHSISKDVATPYYRYRMTIPVYDYLIPLYFERVFFLPIDQTKLSAYGMQKKPLKRKKISWRLADSSGRICTFSWERYGKRILFHVKNTPTFQMEHVRFFLKQTKFLKAMKIHPQNNVPYIHGHPTSPVLESLVVTPTYLRVLEQPILDYV
jgi:hypothetical protein